MNFRGRKRDTGKLHILLWNRVGDWTTDNCVWKDHGDKIKSTGSCSKGSNQQLIVQQTMQKRARLISRSGGYIFPIFRKARSLKPHQKFRITPPPTPARNLHLLWGWEVHGIEGTLSTHHQNSKIGHFRFRCNT